MNQFIKILVKKSPILQKAFPKKLIISVLTGTTMLALFGITAFAGMPSELSGSVVSDLPLISISKDMLKPLVEGVMANIKIVLPVAIPVLATLLGFRIVPAIFSRLTGS